MVARIPCKPVDRLEPQYICGHMSTPFVVQCGACPIATMEYTKTRDTYSLPIGVSHTAPCRSLEPPLQYRKRLAVEFPTPSSLRPCQFIHYPRIPAMADSPNVRLRYTPQQGTLPCVSSIGRMNSVAAIFTEFCPLCFYPLEVVGPGSPLTHNI